MIRLETLCKILIVYLSVLLSGWLINPLSAQIYYGGNGDGHSGKRYLGNLQGESFQAIYIGGIGDGYSSGYSKGPLQGLAISSIFQGGAGDGFTEDRALQNLVGISLSGMFKGGSGDGYVQFWVRGSLQQSIVFPIELLSFEALPIGETVRLSWATAEELNNAAFTIERSLNARDFEPVLDIPGAGTSQTRISYEAFDEKPYSGTSYYRLKSTDFDGAYEYSRTVEVHMETDALSELILYPNPNAGDALSLRWIRKLPVHQVEMSIHTLQGRKIFSTRADASRPIFEAKIPLGESFEKGVYLLTIKGGAYQESKLFIIH